MPAKFQVNNFSCFKVVLIKTNRQLIIFNKFTLQDRIPYSMSNLLSLHPNRPNTQTQQSYQPPLQPPQQHIIYSKQQKSVEEAQPEKHSIIRQSTNKDSSQNAIKSLQSQGKYHEPQENRQVPDKKLCRKQKYTKFDSANSTKYNKMHRQPCLQETPIDYFGHKHNKKPSKNSHRGNHNKKQKVIKKVESRQKTATNELIDQQNSSFLVQNDTSGNEKLEGWVIKNSMKYFYLSNNAQTTMNNNSTSPSTSPHSKNDIYHPKNKQVDINDRNIVMSRPISQAAKNNPFTASQFLKQLKLKYAKIVKQKQQQSEHRNNKTFTKLPPSSYNHSHNHNRIHSYDEEDYKSTQKRNKTKNIQIEQQLSKNLRIHALNRNQGKYLTIDPSQLQFTRIQINDLLKKDRSNREEANASEGRPKNIKVNKKITKINISEKNMEFFDLKANQEKQKGNKIKIKLKLLKSDRADTRLNRIGQKNIERAKIIPRLGSLKKIISHKQQSLLGNNNKTTRNYTEIPWQDRITARGGEHFQKLRELLKKQQSEPVYLLFSKQQYIRNFNHQIINNI